MRIIDAIQNDLEDLYELTSGVQARDFVTTDREWLRRVTGDASADRIPEQLVMIAQPDGVDVSLYLDAGMLESLGHHDPAKALDSRNLADFVTVAEGVSHLLYLAHNAAYDREITGFEMELQAEIDKFFLVQIVLWRLGRGLPVSLPWMLFRPRFHDHLPHALLRRYHRANRWAARYCIRHWRRWLEGEPFANIRRDLRRCYRLLNRHKLAHIRRVLVADAA
ncbi:MAG TPA: hypothetical protein ENK53_09485 [Thiotrichales bacterium]|nr:hypothetical protein [Thiotrichales bacterium]